LAVAALLVAVFLAPWPPLHLFGSAPTQQALGPFAAMPRVAESGTPACRSGSSTTNGSQPGLDLAAVQFVSSEQGWVVGAGRILATEDGGHSWQVQYRGSADLLGVDFVDADHGFAVGDNQLLATNDGGREWSELEEPCLVIRAVDFTSASFGYAVAGGEPFLSHGQFQGGELLVTLDGGHLWHKDTKAPTGIQSLSFATQQTGWIGTPGRVWHTTDGGLHWSVSFTEPGRLPTSSYEGDTALVQYGGLHGAWVLFLGSGVAMSHSPYVAFATRNGQHWHSVMEETYTEQGAMPGVRAPDGPGTYPGPFSAVNADAAVFVGFTPPAPVAPMVIATDNGMKLSSPRAVTGIYEPTGAFFLSSDKGWVIGLAAWTDSDSVIEATSNGGRTWTRQWSSAEASAVSHPTQKTVAVNKSGYPALSSSMLRALLPLNGGQPLVPVSRSKISGAINVQKAVDIATSAPLTKGARVVGASLVRVVAVPAVLTATDWLVLVDPPGPHLCTMSLGRIPPSPSCRVNVYAVAVDAQTGSVLWTGTTVSSTLGPLPVFAATAPPPETPASFLSRSKSGLERSFSAVYQFGGPTARTNNPATFTLAQQAPLGTSAWPGGKPGEWSYRLTNPYGWSMEWVVRGGTVEDCYRLHASKWHCSSGNYPGDAGSNGYTIATEPYLPGTAYTFLSLTVEGSQSRGALTIRTEPSSFGPLTCLVVKDPAETYCLTRGGHFASFFTSTGMSGTAWTEARLVSEQSTAPAKDFTLSGVPKGPFELPPPG
jgi:photosystem II stability/assembly factor-like uncharacterized protein